MAPLVYLVVGHVTQDLVDGQLVLGGTATYSAVTAARLGLKVRVLTAAGVTAQPALEELARDAEVSVVESAETTVFKNTYRPIHPEKTKAQREIFQIFGLESRALTIISRDFRMDCIATCNGLVFPV